MECVMNRETRDTRHLYPCHTPTDDEKRVADVLNRAKETVKEIAAEERVRRETDPTIYNQGLREDAEKQRRALEILKQKSEQHGAQVCTTDGKPPDPDYAELHNAPKPVTHNGQHESYYVLCDSERAKGFVQPVRRTYIHDKCGTVTTMGQALAETYARDPHFYGATFCCACGSHFPVGENGQFHWEDGSKVGA